MMIDNLHRSLINYDQNKRKLLYWLLRRNECLKNVNKISFGRNYEFNYVKKGAIELYKFFFFLIIILSTSYKNT